MPTTNEALRSRSVAHAIFLERYKSGILRDLLDLLNKADRDLIRQIRARGVDGTYTQRRLKALVKSIRVMSKDLRKALMDRLDQELLGLTRYEVRFHIRGLEAEIPRAVIIDLSLTAPAASTVYAAARSHPFEGRTLSEWADGLEVGRFLAVRDAIRLGVVEGETTQQIVTRIRGRRTNNFRDGVLTTQRRHVESVVRTAVNHTVTRAREHTYKANDDLIKGVQWVSTLDDRTTLVCQSRDGKVYPVGKGPRPPAHFRCRSTTTPVLKSFRELGVPIDDIPPAARASMDGQVPGTQTYGDWLRSQGKKVQDDALGKVRSVLFRRGKLSVDKFVDKTGRTYSLAELRQRESALFDSLGL